MRTGENLCYFSLSSFLSFSSCLLLAELISEFHQLCNQSRLQTIAATFDICVKQRSCRWRRLPVDFNFNLVLPISVHIDQLDSAQRLMFVDFELPKIGRARV